MATPALVVLTGLAIAGPAWVSTRADSPMPRPKNSSAGENSFVHVCLFYPRCGNRLESFAAK
jgi:hypothetical protein